MKAWDYVTLIGGVLIVVLLSTVLAAAQIDTRNAEIYVLELDGKAVTFGDFNSQECEALLQSLLPRIAANRKLECKKYKVTRENV